MKILFVMFLCLQFLGCGENNSACFVVKLPDLPEKWVSLLGEPDWRLEWVDSSGYRKIVDISCTNSHSSLEIELPVTWVNPVTAWPYWPGHNLYPGIFRPAGALFPFDVSFNGGQGCISLCWEAGPDVFLYWELARAYSSGSDSQNPVKIPSNFDWLRFRELFNPEESALKQEVLQDPWLIDWSYVAEKTIAASFDRRRLVPEAVVKMEIPAPLDTWYGTSPFGQPLFFSKDETPVFPVRSGINVWVSVSGILRCTSKTWMFSEFDKN